MIFTPIIDEGRSRNGVYCGPTAIALITGRPIGEIERAIRRKRARAVGGVPRDCLGRKLPIKGTYASEVRHVLERFGCKVERVLQKARGETLNAVVTDWLAPTAVYLVEVTGHWMVAHAGKIADTSHHDPVEIKSYRRKARRVVAVWKVTRPKPRQKPDGVEPMACYVSDCGAEQPSG